MAVNSETVLLADQMGYGSQSLGGGEKLAVTTVREKKSMSKASVQMFMLAALAALSVRAASTELSRADGAVRVVFETGFEDETSGFDAAGYFVVDDMSFQGNRSLMGKVDQPNQALFIEVAFEGRAGRKIDISLMARSDGGSVCAMFWRVDKKKMPISRLDGIPSGKWTRLEGSYEFERDERGLIQIAVPSSYNGKIGRAWVDDLLITESVAQKKTH